MKMRSSLGANLRDHLTARNLLVGFAGFLLAAGCCAPILAGTPDTDGDGVPDSIDNCVAVPNPSQTDLDGFQGLPVAPAINYFTEVVSGDLDGDGDTDILSISWYDKTVAWYENLDGTGTYGPARVIDVGVVDLRSLDVADADGDGDNDVFVITHNWTAWYRNEDGLGSFGGPWTIASGDAGGNSIQAVDLDGDDDIDVLYGAGGANPPDLDTLAWSENLDGAGNFAPRVIVGWRGLDVLAVDLDGDQDRDLLAAGGAAGDIRVAWFENTDGAGTFGPEQVFFVPEEGRFPTRVAAGDLDGDGDNDVVVYSFHDVDNDRILWLENIDGAGTFGSEDSISWPNAVWDVGIADVDGDGDNDVVGGVGYAIGWYSNQDGTGDFGAGGLISDPAHDPVSFHVADVNGDLHADVVAVVDSGNDEILWFRNGDGVGDACDNCPGAFNDDQSNQDGDEPGDVCDNCPGVINDDQLDVDADLVGDVCDNCLSEPNTDQVDADLDEVGNACDNCPADANAGQVDLDSDGVGDACDNCPDIANADQFDGDNDDTGFVCDCDDSSPYCATDCTDADLDGFCVTHDCDDSNRACTADCTDGDLDGFCLPFDCDDSLMNASDRDADGIPDPCDNCPDQANPDQQDFDAIGPQVVIDGAINLARPLFAADLDGDDDIDVISAELVDGPPNHEDKIVWFENLDGAGSFATRILDPSLFGPDDVLAADMDGDGDNDVIVVTRAWDFTGLVWLENDGVGNFGPRHTISAYDAVTAFAADMDQDGDLDVVVGYNDVSWYRNTDGLGEFAPDPVSVITNDADQVIAADVDGDGDNDVVFRVESSPEIGWSENTDGAGNLGPARRIAGGSSYRRPEAMVLIDLDGDSDLDVVAIDYYDDLNWYENVDGLGGFGPKQSIGVSVGYGASLVAADLDRDGDADLVAAFSGPDEISWFENLDGAGSFGAEVVISTDLIDPWAVFAADLDGDGDPDILSTSWTDDKVAWYETLDDGAGDLCDCAPSDPFTRRPGDVRGLILERLTIGTAVLSWDPATGADTYKVTRGIVSEISVIHYGSCLEDGIGDTFTFDGAQPDPGAAFGYLVQGVSAACGAGPLGYRHGGIVRVNFDLQPCP